MMQTIQILAIVALLACFEYAMSKSGSCEHFDSNMGATFDLSALKRDSSQPSFIVEDGDIPCTTKVEQNYTYVYNVCGAVSGALPKKCATVPGVNSAGALQVDRRGTDSTDDDFCYMVGSYDPNSYTMKLLDAEDPTKGIELTYYGSNCNNGVQRSFHIQMPCADRLMAVPTHAQELTGCSYTIQMPSVYGCPVECPVSYGALCAANGHCAYDETKGGARCFCNKGYTGGDCSQKATDTSTLNYSPALLGLIITLFIIIVGLAGSIVYMVRQISAYKEDMANYQTLQSSHGMGHEDSAVV